MALSEGKEQETPVPMGLRERSKIKRRQAIKEAAREVFLERGYDDATTREIADRAEVSPGTLFAYAPTKSELVLMIVNDDLDEITSREFEGAAQKTLMDVLLDFCASRYAYWSKLGVLAAPARKEIHGLMISRNEPGPESQRFQERNPRILQGLCNEIVRRQEKGVCPKDVDPMMAARLFWNIYYGEVDRWLRNTKPSLKEGLALVRKLFEITLKGLGASPQEIASQAASGAARTTVRAPASPAKRRKA